MNIYFRESANTMNLLKKLYIVTILLASTYSQSILQGAEYDEENSVMFPLMWVELIKYAYKDFTKDNSVKSCYFMELINGDDSYLVVFSPKSDFKIKGDKISLTQGGNNNCGKGLSYQFNKSGKFIRRIYHRWWSSLNFHHTFSQIIGHKNY